MAKFKFPRMKDIIFSGQGGQYFSNPDYRDEDPWGVLQSHFAGTKVNFKQEVGDPANQSLVMAAVNWLGTQLIEAPLRVYEKNDKGQVEAVEDHDLEKLLQHPTPFFSGGLLYKNFALPWLIYGNVYWLKVRDRTGKVTEIWPLRSEAVSPAFTPSGREYLDGYFYRVEGKDYFIAQEDVVHFRYNLDPLNPRVGLSPLTGLYRELYADNERANFQGVLLRNFGMAGTVVSPDADTTVIQEKGRQALKREFEDQYKRDGRGGVIVSSQKIRVMQANVEPDKLALDVLAQLPEERVAAVLNIPSAILGFGSGIKYTNFATMKELREQAYEGAVIPTQKLIALEIDAQLLPEFEEKGTKRRAAFDLSDVRVLQEDETKMTDRIEKGWKSGLIMRGEARTVLKFPVEDDRDKVFQASAGTALVPEDMADGSSLEPILSVFDQQQAAANPKNPPNQPPQSQGGGSPPKQGAPNGQGQTWPPKQGQGAPPKPVN